MPTHGAAPEAVVDSIPDGIVDARRRFEHGTMDERKRVVRAFADGVTVVGSQRSGQLRMKKLPMQASPRTGSSFEVVAGVRYEAGQRNLGREIEMVALAFDARGTALVPARRAERQSRARRAFRTLPPKPFRSPIQHLPLVRL